MILSRSVDLLLFFSFSASALFWNDGDSENDAISAVSDIEIPQLSGLPEGASEQFAEMRHLFGHSSVNETFAEANRLLRSDLTRTLRAQYARPDQSWSAIAPYGQSKVQLEKNVLSMTVEGKEELHNLFVGLQPNLDEPFHSQDEAKEYVRSSMEKSGFGRKNSPASRYLRQHQNVLDAFRQHEGAGDGTITGLGQARAAAVPVISPKSVLIGLWWGTTPSCKEGFEVEAWYLQQFGLQPDTSMKYSGDFWSQKYGYKYYNGVGFYYKVYVIQSFADATLPTLTLSFPYVLKKGKAPCNHAGQNFWFGPFLIALAAMALNPFEGTTDKYAAILAPLFGWRAYVMNGHTKPGNMNYLWIINLVYLKLSGQVIDKHTYIFSEVSFAWEYSIVTKSDGEILSK